MSDPSSPGRPPGPPDTRQDRSSRRPARAAAGLGRAATAAAGLGCAAAPAAGLGCAAAPTAGLGLAAGPGSPPPWSQPNWGPPSSQTGWAAPPQPVAGWQPAAPWTVVPPRRHRVLRAVVLGVLLVVGVLCFGVALSRDISRLHAAASWPTRPGDSRSMASGDVSAIAAAVDPALVDINVTLAYESAQAAGTGIVLSSSGLVLTNNHVVNGATSLAVTDVGNGQTYQATVLGYDRSHDIALIQLNGASGIAPAQLGDSSKVTVGQSVVAIGNAGGAGGTPSAAGGALVALERQIVASDEFDGTSEQLDGLIETDAAIQPGDSGGPLVNVAGQVIGIDTATSEGYSFSSAGNEGFAVPVNTAMAIARQIENHQSSATVHIGPTAFVGVELAGGLPARRAPARPSPACSRARPRSRSAWRRATRSSPSTARPSTHRRP